MKKEHVSQKDVENLVEVKQEEEVVDIGRKPAQVAFLRGQQQIKRQLQKSEQNRKLISRLRTKRVSLRLNSELEYGRQMQNFEEAGKKENVKERNVKPKKDKYLKYIMVINNIFYKLASAAVTG